MSPPVARIRAPTLFLAAGLAVGLIGLLAASVTWAFHPRPETPCTRGCGPPGRRAALGLSSSGERTYRSQLGFELEYPKGWSRKPASFGGMRGILLTGADRLGADGEVFLLGGAGVTVPDAIAMASDLWNPQVIPNIERLRSLRGAHVGTQDGVGWLFKGTLVPGSGGGRAKNMRLPVIAARRDGRTVLLAGVAFFDKEDARNHNGVASVGMDYLLTEFRWPGGQ